MTSEFFYDSRVLCSFHLARCKLLQGGAEDGQIPPEPPILTVTSYSPTYRSFTRGGNGGRNDTLETLKGVANRFVFSQFYVFLYLGMALLSSVHFSFSLSAVREADRTESMYILD